MGAPRFGALVHEGSRQSCMLSAFGTPRGRWIGLVVFGPETSVGIVQLFFDQMVRGAGGGGAAGAAAGADAGGKLRARAQRQPQSALRTVTGMSLVNFTAREITCKIVYYGPGRSGKTTNLQYVYGRVPESRRGRMVSLATQTDRTLFFDFLPLELGTISGFTTKFQLYTVPGQSYYNATRKLVLQGADGVVFVADSQARRFDDNLESLQNLQDNLLAQGVDIRQLPVVFQYNKQDLPRDLILTHDEMDDALNFRAVPELRRRRAARHRRVRDAARASRSWCSSASPRGAPVA